MMSSRGAARLIGALILAYMVGSGLVTFALEAPLSEAPGFLQAAASHPSRLGLALLLGLLVESFWLGIAVTAYPIFRERSHSTALFFIALGGVILAVAVLESVGVMSMLSLSEAYVKGSGSEREYLQAAAVGVAAQREWAHLLVRILHGSALFLFYGMLYRHSAIPRLLATLGVVASLLMVSALAMPLLGRDLFFPLLAPMALAQLLTSLWLIAKGFGGMESKATT